MRFLTSIADPLGLSKVLSFLPPAPREPDERRADRHDVVAPDPAAGIADDYQVAAPSPPAVPTDLTPATTFWRGSSGRSYRHSAHTLVFCPAPARGIYVLARRDDDGHAVPLYAGVAASPAATLNLAHIRRKAATIGATEVHLCPVTSDGLALRRVARDVRRLIAA